MVNLPCRVLLAVLRLFPAPHMSVATINTD